MIPLTPRDVENRRFVSSSLFLTRSRNERPETKAWAKKLLEVIEGEPVYHHYDELYRTS